MLAFVHSMPRGTRGQANWSNGYLVTGEVNGLLEVVRPCLHQVCQRMAEAAKVHVEGVLAQGRLRDGRPLLQLQQVLPRIPLAVRHHHEAELQVIHAQGSPAGGTEIQQGRETVTARARFTHGWFRTA